MAAVVFPTESSLSVICLTSFGSSDISAIPPALSDTGPKASIATVIAVVESIPTAARAMPYSPAKESAIMIADAIQRSGNTVESIPTPMPLIIVVPAPVWHCSAILFTDLYSSDV